MLNGKNITLRLVKQSDLKELYPFFNLSDLHFPFMPSPLVSEIAFEKMFLEGGFWGEERGMLLLIHEERAVGAIWFERHQQLESIDLSFRIFRKQDREKGFMTEALTLFVKYLFNAKKGVRIQILVPDYRKAVMNLAQKCGFQFEGVLRSSIFYEGMYRDLCVYSQIKA